MNIFRTKLPSRRRFAALALAFVLLAGVLLAGLAAGPAMAQSLNSLRASGAVGEAFDGYARVRVAGGGAARAVEEVNAKRRTIYAGRARDQGITAAQVGRVYARQILSAAPAGTWFLRQSGRWVRK